MLVSDAPCFWRSDEKEAIATSIYLATLENPTDIQRNLSTSSNAIAEGMA